MKKQTDLENLAELPPELAPVAAAMAAEAAQHAAGLARAAAREAEATAAAYELLQADMAAGNPPKGWAEYLADGGKQIDIQP
jgi:hypothetical protein